MLSIDPGLTGTGYVVWQWWAGSVTPAVPIAAGVLTAPAGHHSLGVRARVLADRLRVLQGNVEPWTVVCEFPEYQESSGRSMGWRTGDLQRLTFLIGVIAGRTEGTFIEVTPHVWKGQLPKSVVQQRVINQLGSDVCEMLNLKTHAWDAAGIGLWAIQGGVWP